MIFDNNDINIIIYPCLAYIYITIKIYQIGYLLFNRLLSVVNKITLWNCSLKLNLLLWLLKLSTFVHMKSQTLTNKCYLKKRLFHKFVSSFIYLGD